MKFFWENVIPKVRLIQKCRKGEFIAYKLTRQDLTTRWSETGRGYFKYEYGKKYKIEGELIVCKNGFHCYESIEQMLLYAQNHVNYGVPQVCKISGEIQRYSDKTVSSEITILRPFNRKELKEINKIGETIMSGGYELGGELKWKK